MHLYTPLLQRHFFQKTGGWAALYRAEQEGGCGRQGDDGVFIYVLLFCNIKRSESDPQPSATGEWGVRLLLLLLRGCMHQSLLVNGNALGLFLSEVSTELSCVHACCPSRCRCTGMRCTYTSNFHTMPAGIRQERNARPGCLRLQF